MSSAHPRGFFRAARLLSAACVAALALAATPALAVHPQDGPHADLRLAIEPDEVRFSIGVNLAFVDVIDPDLPRESPDALSTTEARVVTQRLEDFVADEIQVVIDGQPVAGQILSHQMFTDPEPELATVYPNYGARALIRSAIVVTYPVPADTSASGPEQAAGPEQVEVTWPTYPQDRLAAELENLDEAPLMFLDVLLRAEGAEGLQRFTPVEPTLIWRANHDPEASRYEPIPPPPGASSGATAKSLRALLPLAIGAAATIALITAGLALLRVQRAATATLAVAATAAAIGVGAWSITRPSSEPVGATNNASETDKQTIARALLINLYRAFDFTDESDVYDALARSVQGPLLETLYTQVYDSLLQAEQDGLVGIVTDLEPLEIQPLTPTNSAVTDPDDPFAFDARVRWRVEGTVYHFGHTHTRTNEYEADFRIAPRDDDSGTRAWKLIGSQVITQRRLGEPAPYRGEL